MENLDHAVIEDLSTPELKEAIETGITLLFRYKSLIFANCLITILLSLSCIAWSEDRIFNCLAFFAIGYLTYSSVNAYGLGAEIAERFDQYCETYHSRITAMGALKGKDDV